MKRIIIAWFLAITSIAVAIATIGVYGYWAILNTEIDTCYADADAGKYAPGYGQQAYDRAEAEYKALSAVREDRLYKSDCPYIRFLAASRPVWADLLVAICVIGIEVIVALLFRQLARRATNAFLNNTVKDCERRVKYANANINHAQAVNVFWAKLIIAGKISKTRKLIKVLCITLEETLPRKEKVEAEAALDKARNGLTVLKNKQRLLFAVPTATAEA